MFTRTDLITEERLASLREIREKKREESYKELIPVMGEDGVAELRKIYDLFDERMLIWLASLYDPEVGGFYFSESARDTEGFLPDIESTAQAVNYICESSGICKGEVNNDFSITHLPKSLADKISDFAYNLQDEDGYFYHKQWGKEVTHARRGRDCGWAWRMIIPLGRKTKYLRATERKGRTDVQQSMPDYLQDIELFKAWLNDHDLKTKSYPFGNLINATSGQIKAAGPEFVEELIRFLNENQYPENGLWEPQINYASVNGLMKFGTTYPGLGATLPYPERSYESAKTALMSDEPVTFACEFYNAWAALRTSLTSIEMLGDIDRLEAIRAELRKDAAAMIRKTGEKMLKTRCQNGCFAYFAEDAGLFCTTSQGAVVSPDGIREPDVNGNGCSTRGPLRYMFGAFGMDLIPFFTEEDAQFVFELMEAKAPIVKKYKLND